MDDTFERPSAAPKLDPTREPEEEEQDEGDEDQGPDWTKLAPGASAQARPVIPKRGEKEYEPKTQGGSALQRHVLDRSRAAMLDALRATRTISHKSVSHAIWYPHLARAHVTVSRGIHFTTMGHSAARASPNAEGGPKLQKRLELLPEEALYLVERGAMYCWKPTDVPLHKTPILDDMEGVPMSIQEAFSDMVGKEDLTFEKYQVYAYLKRLGYVVTRAKAPTPEYPMPPPYPNGQPARSILSRLYHSIASLLTRLKRVFVRDVDWWRPIRFSRWLHHNRDYASTFKSLRFLPSGHDVSVQMKAQTNTPPSPYEIFYHLYKPSTPFKKTSPPLPDFSIAVVNARTTPMPSLVELTALFGQLPILPPPAPRKRVSFAQQKAAAASSGAAVISTQVADDRSRPALTSWLSPWTWWKLQKYDNSNLNRPPNPFPALRTGNKMVVVAVVDAGTISFFRFGQGVFTEWPMA